LKLLSIIALGAVAALALDCSTHFPYARIGPNFNETIAHAIHAMTLIDLQEFDPMATEANKVPTVNLYVSNVNVEDRVIDHAPLIEPKHHFHSCAMNTIDWVLSHMQSRDDGLGTNWSQIERVVHAFHMKDIWAKIKVKFDTMDRIDDDACSCLLDTKNNGIWAKLAWIAQEYTHDTPISLHEWGSKIPKLHDSATWQEWKKRLMFYYGEQNIYDAAAFLQCATRSA